MPETVIHPDTAQCLMLQGELEGERNWLLHKIEVSDLSRSEQNTEHAQLSK